MNCINIKHPEFKKLQKESGLKSLILEIKVSTWQKETGLNRFPSLNDILSFDTVNYNLKAVDILSSDKAIEVFKKGKKNNWDLNKILTELQIPKEQKQIILNKYKDKVSEQEFIKSIFPDTKVNEVVYHGVIDGESAYKSILKNGFNFNSKSPWSKNDTKFSVKEAGMYFTPDYNEAASYGDHRISPHGEVNPNALYIIPAILNGINISNKGQVSGTSARLKKENPDLDVVKGIEPDTGITNYAVFENKNIHILTEEEQAKIYNQDNLREEIITSLLADNSFVVEVNTATTKNENSRNYGNYQQFYTSEGTYSFNPIYDSYKKAGKEITKEEYDKAFNDFQNINRTENTSYYSNLTVPGGTNYTENEISTPAITPSIKGHAQFSTDNGIGWFRADDKAINTIEEDYEDDSMAFMELDENFNPIPNTLQDTVNRTKSIGGEATKTRRILEVQSDLFQKGRNKSKLAQNKINFEADNFMGNDFIEDIEGNQFLQLLNQKNNWVTFFTKSIIQDSVKKGYEKVLFPKGDTAAKIEGHQTLEEFKKQKENRIKEIENNPRIEYILEYKPKIKQAGKIVFNESFKNKKEAEIALKNKNDNDWKLNEIIDKRELEIKTLKQELADVESGKTQLSSIANFYETTITNILKKNGYNPIEIIDEYDNKWNEIDLSQKIPKSILMKRITDTSKTTSLATKVVNKSNERKDLLQSNLNILFNNQTKVEYGAKELILNLLKNYQFSDNYYSFVELLMNKTNATVKFRNISDTNVPMNYDPLENVIYVDKLKLRNSQVNDTVFNFLHEVVHSVLIEAGRNENFIDNKLFKRNILNVFEEYKRLYDKYKNSLDLPTDDNNVYAFNSNNVDEFIAEVMTNSEFRKILIRLQSEKKANMNLWDRFIEAVRKLFRVKNVDLKETTEFLKSLIQKSNYEGGLDIGSSLNKIKSEADLNINLDSIENRYDYLLIKLKSSLKINAGVFEDIYNNIKNFPTKKNQAKKMKAYSDNLRKTIRDIDNYSKVSPIKAIQAYVNKMNSAITRIDKVIDAIDYSDIKEALNTYHTYGVNYMKTYAVSEDIVELLDYVIGNIDEESPITKDEALALKRDLNVIDTHYNTIINKLKPIRKKLFSKFLDNPIFHTKVLAIHTEKLEKEFKEKGLHKTNVDKDNWINNKLFNRDKHIIQEGITQNIKDIISNPSNDIYGIDVMVSNAANLSSDMINIINLLVLDLKTERTRLEQVKDVEFAKLFNKLRDEKSTIKPEKLYKNLLDKDSEGKYYFKGKYNMKFLNIVNNYYAKNKEFNDKLEELSLEMVEMEDKNSDKYRSLSKEKNLTTLAKNKHRNKFLSTHFTKLGNKRIPLNKYLNDLSNLTDVEKEVLNFFIKLTEKNNQPYSKNSKNVKYHFGTRYYELPKVTKTSLERVWEGDITGVASDFKKDISSVRSDDLGYSNELTDLKGDRVMKLKVPFRDSFGTFDNKDQSLDLFKIMRMDYQMSNDYKLKKDNEAIIRLLLDSITDMKFIQTKGTKRVKSSSTNKYNLIEGEASNTYKYAMNMVETKFYNELHKSDIKLGQVDMNKAVGFFNNASAFATLSLNIASGTANILNAKAQLFLESFISGRYIKASNIAKANKIYGDDLLDIIADVVNPVQNSFTNQLLDLFDTKGTLLLNDGNFFQSNLIKKGLSLRSLQVFQDTGEHYITSVTVMSVLDNVKVMDKHRNYINKEGKIVNTKKEAASVLDMIERNPESDVVQVSDKVVYTTFSKMSKWNEGGKLLVQQLVDKKLKDVIGNYKQTDQPEMMRHWWAKLMMLFRKYFVTMGQSRFRNIENSLKDKDDLTLDQRRYSHALQEFEEGSYVSTIRYGNSLFKFLLAKIKGKQAHIESLSADWNRLSDYEKYNIGKTVKEIGITLMLATIAKMLVAAADDDDELLFFTAYLFKRIDTELSSYRNVDEFYKMVKSPIPSIDILNKYVDLSFQVFEPFDVYKGGKNKDKNKLVNKAKKSIIGVKEFAKQYEEIYKLQTSN